MIDAQTTIGPPDMVFRKTVKGRQKIADYFIFVKLRLTLLVVFSGWTGFILASYGNIQYQLLFYLVFGMFLIVGGANAINEIIERNVDRKMNRTKDRPLPSGRMNLLEAWIISVFMSVAGFLILLLKVNTLTGILALFALINYVVLYTSLKKISTWNTFVGAFSGAIPPVMGWTAVTNEIGTFSWLLFGILFLWQFPHFWSIAYVCRKDYALVGYKMLPVTDRSGRRTFFLITLTTVLLIVISLLPTVLMFQGFIYFFGAFVLGLILLIFAIKMKKERSEEAARRLMFGTFFYLPVLLILMMLNQIS